MCVLPLRIRDQDMSAKDKGIVESQTKLLFRKQPVKTSAIIDLLKLYSSDEHVENFCRLYICLVVFEKFNFPKTNHFVNSRLLKYLDGFDSLNKFNWGDVVYSSLVFSLDQVS